MRNVRTHQSDRKAILILESPWGLDKSDTNRASVLPFVEGIAKLAEHTDVFHANFYDESSFTQALECLCKVKFSSAIMYIAAHGYKELVGGVPISKIIFEIGSIAARNGVTGLMLGSCFAGGNTTTMEVFLEGTGIRWAAGYGSSASWLEGTLIDCAIMAQMLQISDADFSSKEIMVRHFSNAVSLFSEDYVIGEDSNETPVRLQNAMEFVIQPAGSGYRAKTVTGEVFDQCADLRISASADEFE